MVTSLCSHIWGNLSLSPTFAFAAVATAHAAKQTVLSSEGSGDEALGAADQGVIDVERVPWRVVFLPFSALCCAFALTVAIRGKARIVIISMSSRQYFPDLCYPRPSLSLFRLPVRVYTDGVQVQVGFPFVSLFSYSFLFFFSSPTPPMQERCCWPLVDALPFVVCWWVGDPPPQLGMTSLPSSRIAGRSRYGPLGGGFCHLMGK